MRIAPIHWIPALTASELRADLASPDANSPAPLPSEMLERAWHSWPAASIDPLWATDGLPPSRSFLTALGAVDALRPTIFVVARSAAAEGAAEAAGGTRERDFLSRLACGVGFRCPSAAWLPFDDRRLTAIGWVAATAAIEALTRRVRALACGSQPVLVHGETGVGKDLVARALHRTSPRAASPWLALNCAALSESLLESELFGHRRGAFTGALRDRAGLLAAAGDGTLFLDEIGELSLAAQAKLLRAIEERRVRPLGGDQARAIGCRIVAATHRDLVAEVAAHRFRRDLFYRLRGASIELPPLRQRGTDVLRLAERFALHAAWRLGRDPLPFSVEAYRQLQAHRWPGNVRELRQAIETAVLLGAGPSIAAEDLGLVEEGEAPPDIPTIRELERDSLLSALRATGGNRVAAARLLGLSRQSLARRLLRHGLPAARGTEAHGALRRFP